MADKVDVLADAAKALGVAAANEGRSGIPNDDLGLMELLDGEVMADKTRAMKAYRKSYFRRLMDVDMPKAISLAESKPKTIKLPRQYDDSAAVVICGAQRMAKIRRIGPQFPSKKWAVAFDGLSVELTVPKSMAQDPETAARIAADTINAKPWGKYLAKIVREMQKSDCGLSTESAHWIIEKAEGCAPNGFSRIPAVELEKRVRATLAGAAQ